MQGFWWFLCGTVSISAQDQIRSKPTDQIRTQKSVYLELYKAGMGWSFVSQWRSCIGTLFR
jgi:hypothetical protein